MTEKHDTHCRRDAEDSALRKSQTYNQTFWLPRYVPITLSRGSCVCIWWWQPREIPNTHEITYVHTKTRRKQATTNLHYSRVVNYSKGGALAAGSSRNNNHDNKNNAQDGRKTNY